MKEVPFLITNKDLCLIEDLLNVNSIIYSKINIYFKYIKNDEVKEIIKTVKNIHNNHYNNILNILK